MKVYYECDNDGALLDFFSIPKKDKEHSFSKGNVCNSLSKNTGVIGLVDEDSGTQQPSYIAGLGNPFAANHGIKVFNDIPNNNKIVMLCPRLEEWLYSVAKANNINPVDFGLPHTPNGLHSEEFRKVKTKLNDFLEALNSSKELKFLKSQLI
ncbi:MAG: hypothetical protein WCK13_00015 [Ignavibacteriota bacterium]